jgi:hypothetical protein
MSHVASLQAVVTAADVFDKLPNASIAVEPISKFTLAEMKWYKEGDHAPSLLFRSLPELHLYLTPVPLSRSRTFACISAFVSGFADFVPSEISQVMAISSGDSLYVASALLRDPSIDDGPKVRRIPGDICRAGIALLMAPDHTKVQEPEVDKWFMISHNQYDGSKDDHFEATSLHLSFTGSALNIGSRGGKFVHAYFIETNISVFHEGIWVADLDILRCCSEAGTCCE